MGLMLFKAPIKIQHEELPKLRGFIAFTIIQPLSRYKENYSLPLSEYVHLLRSKGKTFIKNLIKFLRQLINSSHFSSDFPTTSEAQRSYRLP